MEVVAVVIIIRQAQMVLKMMELVVDLVEVVVHLIAAMVQRERLVLLAKDIRAETVCMEEQIGLAGAVVVLAAPDLMQEMMLVVQVELEQIFL